MTTSEGQKEATEAKKPETTAQKSTKIIRIFSRVAGIAVLLILTAGILAYTATPEVIRRPEVQHYHFRMQIIVDGKRVNFAEAKFQEGYSKDNCNADLTKQPFHFHDKRDQMAHVHWDGMTGGLLLKYYGWNHASGFGDKLGFRFDQLPKITDVPIHGNVLPTPIEGDSFYVYSGDEHGYRERSWQDFLKQDFEVFFNTKSNLGEQTGLINRLFPKAYAHGSETHSGDTHGNTLTQDELKTINNLLGNVVIFVQKDKPTDTQVKERFNDLVPLEASACGG